MNKIREDANKNAIKYEKGEIPESNNILKEEKDILDDTVIVLLADHYPYDLNINEIDLPCAIIAVDAITSRECVFLSKQLICFTSTFFSDFFCRYFRLYCFEEKSIRAIYWRS